MDDRCRLEDSSPRVQTSWMWDDCLRGPNVHMLVDVIYQELQVQTKALRRDTAVSVGDDSYLLNSAIKKYC